MSKGDFPALRMMVENGRLAPATPFDQERLNSYRRGAIVMCTLKEEKDRVLVRKWWAILSLVVKQCQTPWKTKEEASEAIKLALGIVNLSKTITGNFMQYPASLTELDDPEMQEALDQMIELLSRMTRVDVETLKKEVADVGREIEQPNTDADQSPEGHASVVDEVCTASSTKDGEEASPSSASSPSSPLSAETRQHLTDFARKGFRTLSDVVDDSAKLLAIDNMIAAYREALPESDWPKLSTIKVSLQAVLAGKRTVDQARAFIARDLLDCQISEIGG